MIVGAYRSVQETDLKRILADSTLSALGVLTMLLGVGTREAITAALVYLVAHAGYKGALFLVAGAIDHEVGTRDISALAGLRRLMPMTALAGGAAAFSMAGLPLTLGFIGKDAGYEALLHARPVVPVAARADGVREHPSGPRGTGRGGAAVSRGKARSPGGMARRGHCGSRHSSSAVAGVLAGCRALPWSTHRFRVAVDSDRLASRSMSR